MMVFYFYIAISNLIGYSSFASQDESALDQEKCRSKMCDDEYVSGLGITKSSSFHLMFVCTGNSCRSQMAEGWARHLGSQDLEVNSAGIEAHGLNHKAILVMKEVGVDITNQTSKILTADMITWASLVVTVCDAADERCPYLYQKVEKVHWPFPDPAKATGTEEEILDQFRTTRDAIREKVKFLLATRNVLREKRSP